MLRSGSASTDHPAVEGRTLAEWPAQGLHQRSKVVSGRQRAVIGPRGPGAVSYTHLELPTGDLGVISGGAVSFKNKQEDDMISSLDAQVRSHGTDTVDQHWKEANNIGE